jgi:CheY-like chemotaxis protein
MSKKGPIILVDDDLDDKELFEDTLKEIGVPNELVHFTNAQKAFEYLKTTKDQPFLIFSDVNLPVVRGLDFKRNIDADPQLRKKSIPFVFYSTSVDQRSVNEAYTEMTVQGFFQKGNSLAGLKRDLKLVIDYWMFCRHPNAE